MQDVFIAGYSDKLSARPGETVTFSVSSRAREAFRATLHRSISADPNPDGPGIIEDDASTYFKPSSFPSRYQGFTPGSFAQSTTDLQAEIKADLVINYGSCRRFLWPLIKLYWLGGQSQSSLIRRV